VRKISSCDSNGTHATRGDFVETCFPGRTNFIVFRYSLTSNGTTEHQATRFSRKTVKDNCVSGGIFIVITPYPIVMGEYNMVTGSVELGTKNDFAGEGQK
jgi:uncharacterized membrane protein